MSQYSHLSEHDPELPDSAYKLEDHTVAVEDGEINVRTVSPTPAGGRGGQLPVLVYFHSGGWIFGELDTNDFDLTIHSVDLRLVIVNLDYRLAPEHRFPTGLNDLVWSTNGNID